MIVYLISPVVPALSLSCPAKIKGKVLRTEVQINVYCPEGKTCPVEERKYLRDQRSKQGPRRSFKLGPVDKEAAKRQQRAATEAERQAKQMAVQHQQKVSEFTSVSSA